MKDAGIAARYAKALFLVTEKRGETVAALADMTSMGAMIAPGTRNRLNLFAARGSS